MTDEHDPTEKNTQHDDSVIFPVVGIGASAGGLDAFERFFTRLQPDTNMAFVIVQHLDPSHDSMLVDLLRRYTEVPVEQASDGVAVQPNTIYVIPPNRNMALEDGKLILTEPSQPRGFRLPIDFFFRSLASDQKQRAVCIVLSGAASDGTLGVKAVKGEGGMAMAQEPVTAQHPDMPQNAINTNMVDFVLPPEEMPAKLLAYVNRAVISPATGKRVITDSETDLLAQLFSLIRHQTGHDFSQYKRNTLIRRIERRMVVTQRDSLSKYLHHLHHNPLEVEVLFQDMLIGVTHFFRDEEAFEFIADKVIPSILESKTDGDTIRVWIAGCSTGEEAYGIAILLYDALRDAGKQIELQIFATDINLESIEKARAGFYPDNIEADVSQSILQRHFYEEKHGYRVKKHIRNLIVFAEQSLVKDPPFSRLDLVSCRNLLIYLNTDLQKRVIQLFHYALRNNGYLFLGTSETPAGFDHLFDAIAKKWKVYRRLVSVIPRTGINFGSGLGMTPDDKRAVPSRTLSFEDIARKVLMRRYTPPAVIVNEQGDILYFHDDTSTYLSPAQGTASFNIMKMVIPELRMPISSALREMMDKRRESIQNIVRFQRSNITQEVRLVMMPLPKIAQAEALTLIIFEAVENSTASETQEPTEEDLPQDHKSQRITELEQELRTAREYLQTTIEELETSNEELKSANEELQSSNEELQSTNEELETAKEELQSLNEELVTVNAELNEKIESLTKANNDQKNLMNNMDIGLVFLSDDLRIRLFNPIASDLLNLTLNDIDRPLRHFAANFDYPHLVRDCEEVLDTLEPRVFEVYTDSDRWYAVQLSPYYTLDDDIDGLVVTFAEITKQKKIQQQLETQLEIYDTLLENLPGTAVLIFDFDLRYMLAGGEGLENAGFPTNRLLGKTLFDILPADRANALEMYYRAALNGDRNEYVREFNGRQYRNTAAPVIRDDGTILAGMIIAVEITANDMDG